MAGSAAFAALGVGLATGQPAILLCTSGTAAAHFHAAVIESSLSHVPMLVVTADHGCDPTFPGSDHTREYVPLLVYQKGRPGRNLGIRKSFSDLAQSLAEFFQIEPIKNGQSFF